MIEKLLKIQRFLTPKHDKLGHFYWGFWYTLFSGLATCYIQNIYSFNQWVYFIPFIVSSLLATSKEYDDNKEDENGSKKGKAEWLDWFWTVLPSIIFTILILIH